ncbi:LysR family transcriptional regulator [Exilibacterium tricleocarpae]|uniref:LysR family transcriptional regulator n=1 Tax=Exilibacterium tricleocarpae TaxID=2591008 RepID=A0A545T1S0_9GAMM|nr:LysR family transcriptional regulator [Exilibacterium tricleocarpae]TQV71168.1 LysR family transcriptional regulator [Exilibacterium tricleocarpae]
MFKSLPSPTALRAFEAAVRLGSFKSAAAELVVTPTAISHQIRGLESQLGIALFVRRTRAVEPTAAGARLAGAVNRGFLAISRALEELVADAAILTISTTPAFAALWLVHRMTDFQCRYPGVTLRFETATQSVNPQRDKRVDLLIRCGTAVYDDLVQTPIGGGTIGAYGTPSYIDGLAAAEPIRLFDTRWEQPGPANIDWRTWLARAPAAFNRTPEITRCDQEHYAINAALAGRGLVLASAVLVEEFVKNKWLVPWRPDVVLAGSQYCAYCLPEKATLSKVRNFMQWLQVQGYTQK